MDSQDQSAQRARRRLRGFVIHLIGYFVAMLAILPLNLYLAPGTTWFLLPMVGWGSVLAIHAAYAMGLFDVFRN